MSFGFSLSDIAKAAELALTLHRTCFTKAERAGEFAGTTLPRGLGAHMALSSWVLHCSLGTSAL